ncbi:MAG: class I SAM-dependent methyltransferase [Bacteroidetes bacterium]|nr:class I SAM-dependent methyltransferase [Bacteroidota bacterium]
MSKISKLIKGIAALLKQPYLLNLVLESSEYHQKIIQKKYPEIAQGLPQISFLDITHKKQISVSPFAFLEGGSLSTDLGLLKILAEKKSNTSYFEIGTWRGESVANVAAVAEKCYTLNLSAEEMQRMGLAQRYIDLHGFYSKNLSNVSHLNGHSHSFDFAPYHKKMDLVFIDGDHHYDSVLKDTQTAFSLLKDDNSIIVWHDYTNGPETIRWEVFRGIWEATPHDKRKHLYKVANTQCAVYYPFSVPSKIAKYPETPAIEFKVDMTFH